MAFSSPFAAVEQANVINPASPNLPQNQGKNQQSKQAGSSNTTAAGPITYNSSLNAIAGLPSASPAPAATSSTPSATTPPPGTQVIGANTLGGGIFIAGGNVYSAATGQFLYSTNPNASNVTANGVTTAVNPGQSQSVNPSAANYIAPSSTAFANATASPSTSTAANASPFNQGTLASSPFNANASYTAPSGAVTYYNVPSFGLTQGQGGQIASFTASDLTNPNQPAFQGNNIDYGSFGNAVGGTITFSDPLNFSGTYNLNGQQINFSGTLPTAFTNANQIQRQNEAVDLAYQNINYGLQTSGASTIPINLNLNSGGILGGIQPIPAQPVAKNGGGIQSTQVTLSPGGQIFTPSGGQAVAPITGNVTVLYSATGQPIAFVNPTNPSGLPTTVETVTGNDGKQYTITIGDIPTNTSSFVQNLYGQAVNAGGPNILSNLAITPANPLTTPSQGVALANQTAIEAIAAYNAANPSFLNQNVDLLGSYDTNGLSHISFPSSNYNSSSIGNSATSSKGASLAQAPQDLLLENQQPSQSTYEPSNIEPNQIYNSIVGSLKRGEAAGRAQGNTDAYYNNLINNLRGAANYTYNDFASTLNGLPYIYQDINSSPQTAINFGLGAIQPIENALGFIAGNNKGDLAPDIIKYVNRQVITPEVGGLALRQYLINNPQATNYNQIKQLAGSQFTKAFVNEFGPAAAIGSAAGVLGPYAPDLIEYLSSPEVLSALPKAISLGVIINDITYTIGSLLQGQLPTAKGFGSATTIGAIGGAASAPLSIPLELSTSPVIAQYVQDLPKLVQTGILNIPTIVNGAIEFGNLQLALTVTNSINNGQLPTIEQLQNAYENGIIFGGLFASIQPFTEIASPYITKTLSQGLGAAGANLLGSNIYSIASSGSFSSLTADILNGAIGFGIGSGGEIASKFNPIEIGGNYNNPDTKGITVSLKAPQVLQDIANAFLNNPQDISAYTKLTTALLDAGLPQDQLGGALDLLQKTGNLNDVFTQGKLPVNFYGTRLPLFYGLSYADIQKAPLGKLNEFQDGIARTATENGGYIGGSGAVKLQLPDGTYRNPNDIEVYSSTKEGVDTLTEKLYNYVRDWYSSHGLDPNRVEVDSSIERGNGAIADKEGPRNPDGSLKALIEIIYRTPTSPTGNPNFIPDKILTIDGIQVRDADQVINDKEQAVRIANTVERLQSKTTPLTEDEQAFLDKNAGSVNEAKTAKSESDLDLVKQAELAKIIKTRYLSFGIGTPVVPSGYVSEEASNYNKDIQPAYRTPTDVLTRLNTLKTLYGEDSLEYQELKQTVDLAYKIKNANVANLPEFSVNLKLGKIEGEAGSKFFTTLGSDGTLYGSTAGTVPFKEARAGADFDAEWSSKARSDEANQQLTDITNQNFKDAIRGLSKQDAIQKLLDAGKTQEEAEWVASGKDLYKVEGDPNSGTDKLSSKNVITGDKLTDFHYKGEPNPEGSQYTNTNRLGLAETGKPLKGGQDNTLSRFLQAAANGPQATEEKPEEPTSQGKVIQPSEQTIRKGSEGVTPRTFTQESLDALIKSNPDLVARFPKYIEYLQSLVEGQEFSAPALYRGEKTDYDFLAYNKILSGRLYGGALDDEINTLADIKLQKGLITQEQYDNIKALGPSELAQTLSPDAPERIRTIVDSYTQSTLQPELPYVQGGILSQNVIEPQNYVQASPIQPSSPTPNLINSASFSGFSSPRYLQSPNYINSQYNSSSQYASPLSSIYSQASQSPYASPYASPSPYTSPYQSPYASPYASPSPYTSPYQSPYASPYASPPYKRPLLNSNPFFAKQVSEYLKTLAPDQRIYTASLLTRLFPKLEQYAEQNYSPLLQASTIRPQFAPRNAAPLILSNGASNIPELAKQLNEQRVLTADQLQFGNTPISLLPENVRQQLNRRAVLV